MWRKTRKNKTAPEPTQQEPSITNMASKAFNKAVSAAPGIMKMGAKLGDTVIEQVTSKNYKAFKESKGKEGKGEGQEESKSEGQEESKGQEKDEGQEESKGEGEEVKTCKENTDCKDGKECKEGECIELSFWSQIKKDAKSGNFENLAKSLPSLPPFPAAEVMKILTSLNELYQQNFPKIGQFATIYIDNEVTKKKNELELNQALAEQTKKTDLDKHMDIYIQHVLK